jgi:hypothetical protein
LSDKFLKDEVTGEYIMESPILFHHLCGSGYLPIREVSEDTCYHIYKYNIQALRQGSSQIHLPDECKSTASPPIYHA